MLIINFLKIVIFPLLLYIIYYILIQILFALYDYYERINKVEYLFCYGSNSINQLKYRLISNDNFIYHPAHIENYCMIFGGFSKKWFGSVASICPLNNTNVYGIAVKLTDTQIQILNLYEKGYTKKIMKVYFENSNTYHNAYVYIKNNIKFQGLPNVEYLEAINNMLNDRYPFDDKIDDIKDNIDNNNNNIIIRFLINNKLVKYGYWSKKDGIKKIK